MTKTKRVTVRGPLPVLPFMDRRALELELEKLDFPPDKRVEWDFTLPSGVVVTGYLCPVGCGCE